MSGLLTPAEEFAIAHGHRCTLPSKHLYQGAPYTNSVTTNILARFAAIKAGVTDAKPMDCAGQRVAVFPAPRDQGRDEPVQTGQDKAA
jgi:transposase